MSDEFKQALLIWGIVTLIGFFITIYIIRAVFNIPSILRLHKAQVRLLEEMAKAQPGVDQERVRTVISETSWETLGS
ncbi:MAG: hypothetical protein ACTHMI_15040 [Mucilaginibacter sp.]